MRELNWGSMPVGYHPNLPSNLTRPAVELYVRSLKEKLAPLLGESPRAENYIAENIDRERCLVAIEDGVLVGVLGIKTYDGGFISPTTASMIREYGVIGGIYRLGGLMLLDHTTTPEEWYVDGVAVSEKMRGRGIGTGLIGCMERTALGHGIGKITLSVINTNPRATELYRRLGYTETHRESLWPFNHIYRLPFSHATTMEKLLATPGHEPKVTRG